MTNTEHLNRIAAKCRERIAIETDCPNNVQDKQAIAGWRATIAAIEGLQAAEALIYSVQKDYDDSPTKWWTEQREKVMAAHTTILAAWPEELL